MLSLTMHKLTGDRGTKVLGEGFSEDAARGANVVLAKFVDPSDTGGNSTEICAYGTAIVIEPVA